MEKVTMNKAQLIAAAARKGGVTQREVSTSLDAIIEVMAEAFEKDIPFISPVRQLIRFYYGVH